MSRNHTYLFKDRIEVKLLILGTVEQYPMSFTTPKLQFDGFEINASYDEDVGNMLTKLSKI